MTVKRDFKRRVRQRQARTGESYVTARRHLMASRPAAAADADEPDYPEATLPGPVAGPVDDAGGGEGGTGGGGTRGGGGRDRFPGISVVELVDVNDVAKQFGLVCRVLMYPSLVERLTPARVLGKLREVLLATVGDPDLERLTGLALTGRKPELRARPAIGLGVDALRRFLQRARAGLGGALGDGATLAFHVADGDSMLPILCTPTAAGNAIEVSVIDNLVPEAWEPLAPLLDPQDEPAPVVELFFGALARRTAAPVPLFLVYRGP